jgi:hypothetical protein
MSPADVLRVSGAVPAEDAGLLGERGSRTGSDRTW